ncbi:Coproporphyrinogen oxidase [Ramicandelaber brevisporus]|nr:Coproporphyrinogen oxidase [Ramicandelaber brevisporus]
MAGDLFLPTDLVTSTGKPTLQPKAFIRDYWKRHDGGEGISCVLQDGAVFEKAGVMVSTIEGMLSPAAIQQMRARDKDLPTGMNLPFAATGISLIMHPRNPHCPTVHLNFRYFEIDFENGRVENWFGGGIDLTPAYLYKEDAEYFHRTIKAACDKYDPARFATYKKDCDKYFYSPHRQEARGIGGVFFDDMNDRPIPELFEHVRDVGDSFLRAYLPIVRKRCVQPYNAEERRWQLIRRGRYVEFNLVHDRGTKFGLYTPGARIESILVSMPLSARWEYKHTPVPGSAEAELVEVLKKPREWA